MFFSLVRLVGVIVAQLCPDLFKDGVTDPLFDGGNVVRDIVPLTHESVVTSSSRLVY